MQHLELGPSSLHPANADHAAEPTKRFLSLWYLCNYDQAVTLQSLKADRVTSLGKQTNRVVDM